MRKFSIALVLAAAAAALLIAAPVALAVAFDLEFDELEGGGPGGSIWETDIDDFACDDSLDGNTIDDAELDPDDETPILNQDDAFDDALQLALDDVAFADADDTGDLVTDATGQALTLGPEEMSVGEAGTLNVTLEWKALSSEAKLRTFVTLENPTISDVTLPARWEHNAGSDGDTGIRGSSSGDTSFTIADRWLVTSDDATSPGDPVNTFVFFGPGSPDVTLSSVSGGDEDDCILTGFDTVTVPAGATRYLLFFNQLSQTNEDALTDAPAQFDTNPATDSDLLSGISEEALPDVLNWDFAPPPTPTPTPAPVLAAVQTPTPTPVALPVVLPPSGGSPVDGVGLPWLVVALGAFVLASAAGLALAYQRRRIR